ncbi:hypothetical protein [Natronospora cellulosivora (SeqCode)]
MPEYGIIYNELEEIRSGKYDPIEIKEKLKQGFNGRNGSNLWREYNILQFSL